MINWQTSLHFPADVAISDAVRDLIVKLCCGPEERLGKNGAEEIKAHRFLKDVDFANLRNLPAPYIPPISGGPTDTSNFDAFPQRPNASTETNGRLAIEDYVNGDQLDFMGRFPDHAFFEFTFKRFYDHCGERLPLRTAHFLKETAVALSEAGASGTGPGGDAASQASPVYV